MPRVYIGAEICEICEGIVWNGNLEEFVVGGFQFWRVWMHIFLWTELKSGRLDYLIVLFVDLDSPRLLLMVHFVQLRSFSGVFYVASLDFVLSFVN